MERLSVHDMHRSYNVKHFKIIVFFGLPFTGIKCFIVSEIKSWLILKYTVIYS